MGNCDWWEVQATGRGGWRCATWESGEQYLLIGGMRSKHLSPAVSWDLSLVVSVLACFAVQSRINCLSNAFRMDKLHGTKPSVVNLPS